ncbi:hypothetical protein VTK56DRAFT_3653 [Thermocarpiscus australiensis]
MPPRLIEEGKIQILGQTANSVIYAVATDSKTGLAKDSASVLKGGTVWYEGREALGPGKGPAESDERARKEAGIGVGTAAPTAWAVRLARAARGSLRDSIANATDAPEVRTRLDLAVQFAEGVAHMHRRGIVWGDLSTPNALLFDKWRIKLCDFADSDVLAKYPSDWYGCEVRYCPPAGSDRPQHRDVGTIEREIFALGTAIYEVVEWKVPYGPETDMSEDQVIAALFDRKWPQLADGNPAKAVIRRCWGYMYASSQQVVDDLQGLL